MGGRSWYAWKRTRFIYEVPSVLHDKAQQAREDITAGGELLLRDPFAHSNALTLYRQQLQLLSLRNPRGRALIHRVRRICARPGLELSDVAAAVPRREYWAWIPPSLITHGSTGATFKPYHYSVRGLADMSRRILDENADSDGLARLFGDPRAPSSGIVVSRLPGPLGPIYPITVNGHHRSIALEALDVPAVLAEVSREDPPYRLRVSSEALLVATWPYLNWLHDHGAIRIGSRPITRRRGITIHISAAIAPWIIGHPATALRALAAYESIKGRRLQTLGPLSVEDLRRTWSSTREPDYESGVVEIEVSDLA